MRGGRKAVGGEGRGQVDAKLCTHNTLHPALHTLPLSQIKYCMAIHGATQQNMVNGDTWGNTW